MWKISKAREEFIEVVKRWELTVPQPPRNANTAEEGDTDSDQIFVCADMKNVCSRSSCSFCAPTKSHVGFDRETILAVRPKCKPTRTFTADHDATSSM